MNKNTVISLLKLLAIYIFFMSAMITEIAIYQIFELFDSLTVNPDIKNKYLVSKIFLGCFPLIIHLLFAYILWIKAEKISNKIIPRDIDENSENTVNKNIESILYSLVGIYLLFSTIPELAKFLYSYMSSITASFPESRTYKMITGTIISLIIKTTLSLWLIFGSQWWIKIIHQIKNYKIKNIK